MKKTCKTAHIVQKASKVALSTFDALSTGILMSDHLFYSWLQNCAFEFGPNVYCSLTPLVDVTAALASNLSPNRQSS